MSSCTAFKASFIFRCGLNRADGFGPMLRGKAKVIVQAASVILLASLAGADAADVAICSLVAKPSSFDRQTITFQGMATAVKKKSSRRGNDYTLFKLQGPGGLRPR